VVALVIVAKKYHLLNPPGTPNAEFDVPGTTARRRVQHDAYQGFYFSQDH